MINIQSPPLMSWRLRATVGAAQLVLLAGTLFVCGLGAGEVSAQSLELHAAFNEVHDQVANDSPPSAEDVRVAANPKPPAKPTKPPQPVAQKSGKTPPARPVPPQHPATAADSSLNTEALPMPPMAGKVPFSGADAGDGLKLTKNDKGLITLVVRDKSLSQVLALIAQTQDLNIVASNDIDALISITLRDVPIEEALTAILSVANYTWVKRNNIILITSLTDAANLSPDVQGRQIQVFDLDFVSATAIAETVKNFLSPVGKVTIGSSNPANNKLTQERIVVEDVPDSVARIADYICQVDHAPRQVLIETHVLQIELDDTNTCGVDLNAFGLNGIIDTTGSATSFVPQLGTNGLASPTASPAFVAKLGNKDIGAVIELLEKTTDAKSLGSPKLLVINEQEARLQVGQHIGYQTAITTQTSTTQNVQFLDVGVVLRMTPRITHDGRVLLHVRPEVSDGKIDPDTKAPTSNTAELETDVMLNDNQGMIIGGLIKETDRTDQSKVPYLGNVRGIGFLFRRSTVTKQRQEIIVALVPRIQPYDKQYHDFEQGEWVKASVPLFHGPLCRTDRPWDATLPDGKRISYPLIPMKRTEPPFGYFHDLGPRYQIPPNPLPEQEMCEAPCGEAPLPIEILPEGQTAPTETSTMLPTPTSSNSGEMISDH
jgi:type IV pilus assembly protein PilQ